MKIIVKRPNLPIEIADVDFRYRGECGNLIGDRITTEYVEIVDRQLAMMVDEDGLCKELPRNFLLEVANPFFPVQQIVGTVVFCRYKMENTMEKEIWDYELLDVTEKDVSLVSALLSNEKQQKLEAVKSERGGFFG